jgi:hypothetical protein
VRAEAEAQAAGVDFDLEPSRSHAEASRATAVDPRSGPATAVRPRDCGRP